MEWAPLDPEGRVEKIMKLLISLSSIAIGLTLVFAGEFGTANTVVDDKNTNRLIQRIVVGSCLKQDDPQPCWNTIRKESPDLMILCGDGGIGNTCFYPTVLDYDNRIACLDRISLHRCGCRAHHQ